MFVYVNYILTQQCPAKDGGARRYVPWTAHKSRLCHGLNTLNHNSYCFLAAVVLAKYIVWFAGAFRIIKR